MLAYTKLTDFNVDIYLLRHGRSTANEQRLVCGASDYPLSAEGISQATRVCHHLSKIPFTRIYSSPLSRAYETISTLKRQVEITREPELIELDTGAASHLHVDQLWAEEPRYRYQGLNPDLRYPGGECLNDMLHRIGRWYERRSQAWTPEDTILISGHEGTVCGILHHLLELSVTNYPTFAIGNCDYVRIKIDTNAQVRYQFVPLTSVG